MSSKPRSPRSVRATTSRATAAGGAASGVAVSGGRQGEARQGRGRGGGQRQGSCIQGGGVSRTWGIIITATTRIGDRRYALPLSRAHRLSAKKSLSSLHH